MSVNSSLLALVLPLAGLEEGLNRLSSLSAFTSSVDNQIRDWTFEISSNKTIQTEYGLTSEKIKVHSGQQFIDAMRQTQHEVMSHIRFRTYDRSDVEKIDIWYYASSEGYYQPELDLVILAVDCNSYGSSDQEAANLFLPQVRPGLFRLLEALNPLYGYVTVVEGVADYDAWYGPDDPYKPPDKLVIYAPVVIGQSLVPTLGLERLRAAEPFAKFELAGPMFVYANHDLFYRLESSGRFAALSKFTHQTSWATPQHIDFDDYLDQRRLSDEKLNAALGLPVEIDVREL